VPQKQKSKTNKQKKNKYLRPGNSAFTLPPQEKPTCWVLVAHACNPSYSGERDQEDHGLKPAWANSP
jgi:hypothetical protein